MLTSSGEVVIQLDAASGERAFEDRLNALRFRNRVKKSLLEDEDMDSVKLEQIISTASFICDSLNPSESLSTNGSCLRTQLEELKGELLNRLKDANHVMDTVRPVADQIKRGPSSIKKRTEVNNPNNTNETSGESIHTLLQQQKVTSD